MTMLLTGIVSDNGLNLIANAEFYFCSIVALPDPLESSMLIDPTVETGEKWCCGLRSYTEWLYSISYGVYRPANKPIKC